LQIFAARTKTLVVDSGVIDSPVPSLALRQGLNLLKASTKYTFELSVWTSEDISRWPDSRAAHATARGQFHTALFSPAEWSAEWIGGGTMLRSSLFSARNNTMVSASLFASGIGCFSLTINGISVDTAYPTSRMDPGFSTAPRARLLYRAYDVLPLLDGSDGSSGSSSNSSNKTAAAFVVGVRLGFCKYGFLYNECEGAHATHAKCRAISLQLTMTYADGSKQTVQTNTNADSSSDDVTWTATTIANPTRYTHLYHGEIFDARVEQRGWDTPAATAVSTAQMATAWQPAIAYPNPEKSRLDVLSLHKFPPMGVAAVVAPVKSWMVAANASRDNTSTQLLRRVFDFGNNYAGVTKVTVTGGAPGAVLTMRHTEIADDNDGRMGPVENYMYTVNPDGTNKNCFDRVLVDGNCANQTDQLILGTGAALRRGGVASVGADGPVPYAWSPLFTYHGFRYMQLEMTTGDAATIPGGIESIQVELDYIHTMVESAGGVKFNASSAEGRTLNKIQMGYLQTQRNNLHSIPTDCPTREKRGWMADAAVTSTSALLNFRLSSFYANWLRTVADTQTIGCSGAKGGNPDSPYTCCNPLSNVTNDWGCTGEDFGGDLHGSLPTVVPQSRFTAFDPQNQSLTQQPAWPGDPIWMAAAAILPLEHYRSTGDVAVAGAAYPAAKALVDWYARQGDPLINFGNNNDWLAIEACKPFARRKWALPGPTCVLANISFASAQIVATDAVARLAEAVGADADAHKYFALLERLKPAFHHAFFDNKTKAYAGGYQTVQILPLYFNVTPPAQQASVVAALVKSLTSPTGPTHDDKHDCNGTTPCLASGFWGTRYALQALAQHGQADLALALSTKTAVPSWGAMVNSKPGTLWEAWIPPKSGAQSRNHPAFGGGIAAYMYVLAGIAEATNHAHLVIALPKQAAAAAMGGAQVTVDSGAGAARTKAALHWSMTDEELEFEIHIPVGFTGKAIIASLPPPLCSYSGNAPVLSDVSNGGALLSREDLSWRDKEGNAIDIPLATTGITRLHFSCKADGDGDGE
jgi:alpha-L-rhamnosidase